MVWLLMLGLGLASFAIFGAIVEVMARFAGGGK